MAFLIENSTKSPQLSDIANVFFRKTLDASLAKATAFKAQAESLGEQVQPFMENLEKVARDQAANVASKTANVASKTAPFIPYQKVTPHISSNAEDTLITSRVAALFKGVTYTPPITARREKTEVTQQKISALSESSRAFSIPFSTSLPSMQMIGKEEQTSMIESQSRLHRIAKQEHPAIIGTFECLDRITRGEHNAEAAQLTLNHIRTLQGADLPESSPAKAILPIAKKLLIAEVNGLRDLRNADVTNSEIRKLSTSLTQLSTDTLELSRSVKDTIETNKSAAHNAIEELKLNPPKRPSFWASLIQNPIKKSTPDARSTTTYDQKFESYEAELRQLKKITQLEPPERVAEYKTSLIGIHDYYCNLAIDTADQLHPDAAAPNILHDALYSMGNATGRKAASLKVDIASSWDDSINAVASTAVVKKLAEKAAPLRGLITSAWDKTQREEQQETLILTPNFRVEPE